MSLAGLINKGLKAGVSAAKSKGVGNITASGASANFGKSVTDVFSGLWQGTKATFGESFVDSFKTVWNAGEKTKLGSAGLALVGGALVNGGLIAYNTVNAMEDTRRIKNMSQNLSDFYTPYSDAYNTLKLSAGAAGLGLAPAAFGGLELLGDGMQKVAQGKGSTSMFGAGLSRVGKTGNWAFKGVFGGIGNTLGRGIDSATGFAGKLFGKNWKPDAAKKILGKHYWLIAGLTAARAAYKTLKIDMIKQPNSGIASLNIGGKSLFIDNDPSSPTFRQSIFLKQAIAKRQQENLERSFLSGVADQVTGGAQAAYSAIG